MVKHILSLHAITFFTGSDSTAYVESRLLNTPTIRHRDCKIVVAKENSRCQACVSYRRCLRIMVTRLESRTESDKENRTAPCSRVSYSHLTTPEKNRQLSRLHSSLRSANRRIARLKARLEDAVEHAGEVLDEPTHDGLQSIMAENSLQVTEQFPPNSFARIFWEQQMSAAKAKTASAMRWHPLMIKWCLHIRHLSSGAYEALQKSGCLSLLSQCTLRDYTHYAEAKSGFSMDVDRQLIEATQVGTSEAWEKCIILLMDEMHIREDLVYDKVSGTLYLHTTVCTI